MPGPVAINGRDAKCPTCGAPSTQYDIEDRGKVIGELISCSAGHTKTTKKVQAVLDAQPEESHA